MALRRGRDASDWVVLPKVCELEAPEWPLPSSNRRERDLWVMLWRRPPAVMWHRLGLDLEVGLYVRRFVEAEKRDAKVTLSTLVRQMGDSLGLTATGLRANRWVVEGADGGVSVAAQRPRRPSTRDRLRVVDPDERPGAS